MTELNYIGPESLRQYVANIYAGMAPLFDRRNPTIVLGLSAPRPHRYWDPIGINGMTQADVNAFVDERLPSILSMMAPYRSGRTLPDRTLETVNRLLAEFDAVSFKRRDAPGETSIAVYDTLSDAILLDCAVAVQSRVVGRYLDDFDPIRAQPLHLGDSARHGGHRFVSDLRHELAHWDLGMCPYKVDPREIILTGEEVDETMRQARTLWQVNPGGYRAWILSDASERLRSTIVPPKIRNSRLKGPLMNLSFLSFTALRAAELAWTRVANLTLDALNDYLLELGITHTEEALACLYGGGTSSYRGFLSVREIPHDDPFSQEVWETLTELKRRQTLESTRSIVCDAATVSYDENTPVLPLLKAALK